MNKRIEELALQSKLRPALLLHHWGKIDALTDSEQEELEQLEKFAELIVRECAHIAWLNSTKDNVSHIVIKQHFGVEE